MKSIFYVVGALALFTACQSETHSEEPDNERKDIELTRSEVAMTESGNSFALDLFRETNAHCKEQGESNFLLSPLSASVALAMTCNGASGTTAEEMKTALGLKDFSQEEMNTYYKKLVEGLFVADKKTEFTLANSIWVNQGFPVLPSFTKINREIYDAETRNLDFTRKDAVDIINQWCADHTHNKIREVLDAIDPNQRIFLINALYFKDEWTEKFDKADTQKEDFTNEDGTRVKVDMMNNKEYPAKYYYTPDVAMAELPYGNEAFSMVVMLPSENSSIDALIGQLTLENWNDWMEGLFPTTLVMKLPKFENKYKLNLIPALKVLGMQQAFCEAADFSKMSNVSGLFINIVKQDTYIQVNEEGTEAAAVTVVGSLTTSPGPSTTFFYVNRPFIYVIKEKSTGAILFIGKIEKM